MQVSYLKTKTHTTSIPYHSFRHITLKIATKHKSQEQKDYFNHKTDINPPNNDKLAITLPKERQNKPQTKTIHNETKTIFT